MTWQLIIIVPMLLTDSKEPQLRPIHPFPVTVSCILCLLQFHFRLLSPICSRLQCLAFSLSQPLSPAKASARTARTSSRRLLSMVTSSAAHLHRRSWLSPTMRQAAPRHIQTPTVKLPLQLVPRFPTLNYLITGSVFMASVLNGVTTLAPSPKTILPVRVIPPLTLLQSLHCVMPRWGLPPFSSSIRAP
jgi:hypothetical protein